MLRLKGGVRDVTQRRLVDVIALAYEAGSRRILGLLVGGPRGYLRLEWPW